MAETTTSSAPETRTSTEDGWPHVLSLPCDLTVELPVRGFFVRDLVQLNKGSVVDSRWLITSGVPLLANGERIAWGELDAVAKHLAFRLTELA